MDGELQIQTGGVESYASDIAALYERLFKLSLRLEAIKKRLCSYWQDEHFLKYTQAYDRGLDCLDGLKVALDAVEKLLEEVSIEYLNAEKEISARIG